MRWLALLFISFEALGQGLPGGERVEFGGIFGDFFRPASNGKAPAIVIVHGSGGVTAAREGFWAGELRQAWRRWSRTASRRAACPPPSRIRPGSPRRRWCAT